MQTCKILDMEFFCSFEVSWLDLNTVLCSRGRKGQYLDRGTHSRVLNLYRPWPEGKPIKESCCGCSCTRTKASSAKIILRRSSLDTSLQLLHHDPCIVVGFNCKHTSASTIPVVKIAAQAQAEAKSVEVTPNKIPRNIAISQQQGIHFHKQFVQIQKTEAQPPAYSSATRLTLNRGPC